MSAARPRPPRALLLDAARAASSASRASPASGAVRGASAPRSRTRQAVLSRRAAGCRGSPALVARSGPKWLHVTVGVSLIVVAVALTVGWQILARRGRAGARGEHPRGGRLLLRHPALPAPHRRPVLIVILLCARCGSTSASRTSSAPSPTSSRPRSPRSSSTSTRCSCATCRRAAARVLPDDAPGPRAPERHHQQRAERGHVHRPAGGGPAAPRPREARAPRHRADAHAPPAPARGASATRARRACALRGDAAALETARPQPARQRGQVLEGARCDVEVEVAGRRRRPGPPARPRPRRRHEPRPPAASSSTASTASAPRCGAAGPAPGLGLFIVESVVKGHAARSRPTAPGPTAARPSPHPAGPPRGRARAAA